VWVQICQLAVVAYKVWWGLCGKTKFYRSCAAFEHRGNECRADFRRMGLTSDLELNAK